MSDLISPELVAVLRGLKLSLILLTLPDRLAPRQQKLPYQELLLPGEQCDFLIISPVPGRRRVPGGLHLSMIALVDVVGRLLLCLLSPACSTRRRSNGSSSTCSSRRASGRRFGRRTPRASRRGILALLDVDLV